MTGFKFYILFIPLCFLLCIAVYPQQATDTALLRKTIERFPDSLSLHRNYINTYLKESAANTDSLHPPDYPQMMKRLGLQYDTWIKKYPSSYTLPFAMGDALCNMQLPGAKKYLQATVTVNPLFAPAWADLYLDAQRWGDYKSGQEYIRKAEAVEPDNVDYAFYSVINLDRTDTAEWRNKIYSFVKQFPRNERGAQALYWLAYRAESDTMKTETYERLRKLYLPEKFDWPRFGMDNYFSFLLDIDSARKALELSQYMLSLFNTGSIQSDWVEKKELANDIYTVDNMLQKGIGDLATNVAESLNIPVNENIDLLKAKTLDAAGSTTEAYKIVLNDFAEMPGEKMLQYLKFYGRKSGKDKYDIDKDVWKIRTANERHAPGFTFLNYMNNDSLPLSSLKGKVVFVSFWFPGCGPCRSSFPHIESAMKKFNRDSIAYIGINIESSQDDYVNEFIKNTGYSFIPLYYNYNWPDENTKVHTAPENLLLDKNGNIVYENFPVSDYKEEKSLEMMIRSLLDKHKPD